MIYILKMLTTDCWVIDSYNNHCFLCWPSGSVFFFCLLCFILFHFFLFFKFPSHTHFLSSSNWLNFVFLIRVMLSIHMLTSVFWKVYVYTRNQIFSLFFSSFMFLIVLLISLRLFTMYIFNFLFCPMTFASSDTESSIHQLSLFHISHGSQILVMFPFCLIFIHLGYQKT